MRGWLVAQASIVPLPTSPFLTLHSRRWLLWLMLFWKAMAQLAPDANGYHPSKSARGHERTDRSDIDARFVLEEEHSPFPYSTSHSSSQSLKEVIAFAPGDQDNPHNWSNRKKSFVVFNGVALVSVGFVRRVCVSNRNSGHVFDDRVVDSSRSVAPICYLLQHHEPSAAGLADILVPGRIRCWPATVRSAK